MGKITKTAEEMSWDERLDVLHKSFDREGNFKRAANDYTTQDHSVLLAIIGMIADNHEQFREQHKGVVATMVAGSTVKYIDPGIDTTNAALHLHKKLEQVTPAPEKKVEPPKAEKVEPPKVEKREVAQPQKPAKRSAEEQALYDQTVVATDIGGQLAMKVSGNAQVKEMVKGNHALVLQSRETLSDKEERLLNDYASQAEAHYAKLDKRHPMLAKLQEFKTQLAQYKGALAAAETDAGRVEVTKNLVNSLADTLPAEQQSELQVRKDVLNLKYEHSAKAELTAERAIENSVKIIHQHADAAIALKRGGFTEDELTKLEANAAAIMANKPGGNPADSSLNSNAEVLKIKIDHYRKMMEISPNMSEAQKLEVAREVYDAVKDVAKGSNLTMEVSKRSSDTLNVQLTDGFTLAKEVQKIQDIPLKAIEEGRKLNSDEIKQLQETAKKIDGMMGMKQVVESSAAYAKDKDSPESINKRLQEKIKDAIAKHQNPPNVKEVHYSLAEISTSVNELQDKLLGTNKEVSADIEAKRVAAISGAGTNSIIASRKEREAPKLAIEDKALAAKTQQFALNTKDDVLNAAIGAVTGMKVMGMGVNPQEADSSLKNMQLANKGQQQQSTGITGPK